MTGEEGGDTLTRHRKISKISTRPSVSRRILDKAMFPG